MNYLFYDDSPVFGGHEVMTLLGIEALLSEPGVGVRFLASVHNSVLLEKLKGIAARHPSLQVEAIQARSSKLEGLKNRLIGSRVTRLAGRLAACRPSLVVAVQGNIEHSSLALLAARRAGIPVASYIPVPHSHVEMGAKFGGLRDLTTPYLFKLPDRFITISHETFSRLLWVGRMNDDKDPFTAIRALAEAHRRGLTSLTLDLYGGGTPEDLARVDAEIASLGLKGHVQRRSVPADEMRALYARYDALVFTSNWGEPFALTPLEAGASGLPVISSLDGGQAELVQDGINSVKAQAADASSYADAIVRLHSDRELREKIASHALEAVREKFDIAPISRQIERFLIETLEQHPITRSSPPQHHASPPY